MMMFFQRAETVDILLEKVSHAIWGMHGVANRGNI